MSALSLGFIFSAFLAVLFRPDFLCQHGCKEVLVDPEQCGENEVYHHANKTNYCIMGCKSGCVCKPGYVMMDTKCVPQKFSDISPCKENEELKCGNYDCQTFCDLGPDPLCYLNRFDCYYEYACMCKEGYIRIDEGDCIPIDECPSKVFHLDYEED
ncbi:hypothetical protein PVAND_002553 [Polypedilum vanderplanki]|uniref:Protease inhibitor n=1 Tax=Polypedilum vanderplanki TaxID=319348 RepID=A0A9J6BRU6_POLVA|nr:hypothetical protein PVAND_002553 [Polypedilum vanderplanki]